MLQHGLRARWKKEVSRLTKGNEAQYCGQLFNHRRTTEWKRWSPELRPVVQPGDFDWVRSWKKNGCFTLLRRITNSKVSIQRSIQHVKDLPGKVFPEGFLPTWRTQQEWHTCSETSYRITDVERIVRAKTIQLNLTGDSAWMDMRNCGKSTSYVLALKFKSFWCSSVRLREPCKKEMKNQLFGNGKVVLGLATSHQGNLTWTLTQVRHGDQPWYPHVLWPLRRTIAHSTWMVPLLEMTWDWDGAKKPKEKQLKQAKQSTRKTEVEVLHLFRCSTHTHTYSCHT